MTTTPMPGDVWSVRTEGILAWFVRLGARIRYLFSPTRNVADLDNHVLVVTHQTDGVWWGIEGKPGGVGWADLTRYIDHPATVTNYEQPKTDEQRAQIVALIPQVLGTPYDWSAIFRSVATDLHLPSLFRWRWGRDNSIAGQRSWGTSVPGQVICSSLADFLYSRIGLASPPGGRYVQPSDWCSFNTHKGWEA